MSTQTQQRSTMAHAPDMPRRMANDRTAEMGAVSHRRDGGTMQGKETKSALMSTEFWIYLLAVGGTLLASYLVGRNAQGVDPFQANQAWWYIALLTIGYLGSRGLAKAGSSNWRRSSDGNG